MLPVHVKNQVWYGMDVAWYDMVKHCIVRHGVVYVDVSGQRSVRTRTYDLQRG